MTDGAVTAKLQGMTIACPDGWRDKSMLILEAGQPGPAGVTPNLVITREVAPGDLPAEPVARLEEFVERQLGQMRTALAGFTVVVRRHALPDGAPPELQIDWLSGAIPLTQWITYADGGRGTLTLATATVGRGEFAALEAGFRTMLQSYRLI